MARLVKRCWTSPMLGASPVPGRTSGAWSPHRSARTLQPDPIELRRALAIVRRVALSLAILVNLLATTAAWGAGSCSSQAHDPLLSAGSASPASGTTATVFTFTVTYADTKGCAPNWVRVTVAGVGVFPMTGSGTSYDTGVVFTRAMQGAPCATSWLRSSGEPVARRTTIPSAVRRVRS